MIVCGYCQKIIWPWQEKSYMGRTPDHAACKRKVMAEFLKNRPDMASKFEAEVYEFEKRTGKNSGLRPLTQTKIGES